MSSFGGKHRRKLKKKVSRSHIALDPNRDDTEQIQRAIRFEKARLEIIKWKDVPTLDVIVSYINSAEGDFRAKFEAYCNMINIISALMATISIPGMLSIKGLGMDEDSNTYLVTFYCFVLSSSFFMMSLLETSTWIVSGMSFCGSDLDTLALITVHYPGGLLLLMTLGFVALVPALFCFMLNILQDVGDATVHQAILGIIIWYGGLSLARNKFWMWGMGFNVLRQTPTVYWDGNTDTKIKIALPAKNDVDVDDASMSAFETSNYNWVWDPESSTLKNDGSGHNTKPLLSVNEYFKLHQILTFDYKTLDEVELHPRFRQVMEEVRKYYIVPTSEIEPPMARLGGNPFSRFMSKLLVNQPFADDSTDYVQWLFSWQPTPKLLEILKTHVNFDPIEYRTVKDVQNLGVDDTEFDGFQEDWAEGVVKKALGTIKRDAVDALSPFSKADFEGLAFSDKLAALSALGTLTPVQQIKLAKAL